MNTVGKAGRLGGDTRCVVSVSMLTEGWDASTVTHVLGVCAFGTQLLCEQVIGRALRRQSYDLNEEDVFDVEYADVLGIPFDFTARPVVAPPQPPRETVQVKAISPERDACEIRFLRVQGYRVELPEERLSATFDENSTLELTPDLVGPSITRNEGIVGEGVDLSLEHLEEMRPSTLVFHLTKRLLETKWRDPGEEPKLHLFGQLKRITRQWLNDHLVCKGGTWPAQLLYQSLADTACERITRGIVARHLEERPVQAVLDPYNSIGSSIHVRFTTSKKTRWETNAGRCHVNWVVCDSEWEETSRRNRVRTGLDEVPQEARLGERSGQPGNDGGTTMDAKRPRGLETHARSGLERCQKTSARPGQVDLVEGPHRGVEDP